MIPTFLARSPALASAAWDQFAFWATRFRELPEFDRAERDYKLRIAERLRDARDALLAGRPDWTERLKVAFGGSNNLTNRFAHNPFLQWCGSDPDAAGAALRVLWAAPDADTPPIRAFLERVPREVLRGRGTRLNVASFLAMALGIDRFPIYHQTPLVKAFRLTGHQAPPADADEEQLYAHALDFFDTVSEQMAQRGLRLRDRLDVQSVAWCISHWKADKSPIVDWPDRDAFVAYRGSPSTDAPDDPSPIESGGEELSSVAPVASAWLFQGNPATNPGLLDLLAKAKPGDVDHWRVSRHGNEMRPGDPAVVWVAGPNGGIYALGEIVGDVFDREIPPWDRVDATSKATEKAINLRYTHVLPTPIGRSEVVGHPVLATLSVLDIARQTNYRVTPEQWAAIRELVGDPPDDEEKPPSGYEAPTFEEIRARIAAKGLRLTVLC